MIDSHIDPINVPDKATRDLLGGPLQIELRGYEVAREVVDGWALYAKYRPNNVALAQARADAKWLNARSKAENYRVRPIVSLNPPLPVEDDKGDELHLEADAPEQAREDAAAAFGGEVAQ